MTAVRNFIGGFAVPALVGAMFALGLYTLVWNLSAGDPFGGYCYTVIDSRGTAHPSESEPLMSPGVLATYQTPDEQGVVTGSYVVCINAECTSD